MKLHARFLTLVTLIAVSLAVYTSTPTGTAAQSRDAVSEILYRNNRGVALLDQYKFKEAAEQFQAILDLDRKVMPAYVNIGIAYFYDQKYDEAAAALEKALSIDSNEVHALYVLGLIYRNQDDVQSSIQSFEKVNQQDQYDPSTNYYLGRLYMRQRDYTTASTYFRKVIDQEPYNASAHYNLATALSRSGNREEGQEEMQEFKRLQSLFGSTTVGLQYLEQGKYAIAIDNIPSQYLPGVVREEPAKIDVVFTEVGELAGLNFEHSGPGKSELSASTEAEWEEAVVAFVGSGLAFGDFDKDGWFDLYIANAGSKGALFRNKGDGTFADVSNDSGISYSGNTMHSFWGDYDNDGYDDLYLVNYGSNVLYHNERDGTFRDVTEETATGDASWGMGGSFVDYDHDGDLDIFVANFTEHGFGKAGQRFPEGIRGAQNRLYRNNGDGSFTDVSGESNLSGGIAKTTALVSSDLNNNRDVDFFLINFGASNQLFNNMRDGTFKPVQDLTMAGHGTGLGLGAGDINRDGLIDIALPSIDGEDGGFYINRGVDKFQKADAELVSILKNRSQNTQLFDYDNDGDLDILILSAALFTKPAGIGRNQSFRLFEDQGDKYQDVTSKTGLDKVLNKPIRGLSIADYDKDGDLDFVASVNGGSPLLLRNDGGNKNNWLSVRLVGTNSNKSGLGVKAEVKAGNLWQKKETFGGDGFLTQNAPTLHFGLGKHRQADVVRLVWPNGVLQSEIDTPVNQEIEIQELDRKGTSCPILYVWDGTTYRFQTDFLGGSAYGSLVAPGSYNYPDTDEYIKLKREDVKLRDGHVAITMNNQLEEVIMFDHLRLIAVDHPSDYEVYPDEKLLPGPPYQGFAIFTAASARPPLSAVDDRGQNVLDSISRLDRIYPEIPGSLPFKGYSEPHELILDLGPISDRYAVLLMHAWIDYADSTSNLAASQAGITLIPPYLQVLDENGEWVTVIERMGFPAGLPKDMTVDLSGKFLTDSRKVKIVTNMKIYWDRILVESGEKRDDYVLHELNVKSADLRYKGYPEFASPDGRLPKVYTYDSPSTAEWKVHVGAYTRFGDVTPLVSEQDDMFVITRSGDEIEAQFEVSSLPEIPEDWVRDYLVYVDGFGKDMDPNSAAPNFLGPLPFHGMSAFPYPETEQYPDSEEYRKYLREWNTRIYESSIPDLRTGAESED